MITKSPKAHYKEQWESYRNAEWGVYYELQDVSSRIAQPPEARETYVSLELIQLRQYLREDISAVLEENSEIIAILTSIGKSTQRNLS
jgi:hypothetical protein